MESYLNILGITDLEAPFATLSGGQKRKAALARALSQDFDVLLLDEPTNHLDMEMTGWLEEYLRNMRKTLLMVTHDRYFLDRTVNKILEISRGSLYEYEADYSGFLELKAQREEMEAGLREKTAEYPADRDQVGPKRLQSQKHQAKGQTGKTGRTEKRKGAA